MIKSIFITLACSFFASISNAQDEIKPIPWKENWKLNIGLTCYRTNMLLHDGLLYIGSNGSDWNEKIDSLDGVYIINPKTGEIVHHIQHKALGDNDVNGLAISKQGTLFFGGDMQYMYAFNTETFNELWKYKVGADIESVPVVTDLNGDNIEDAVVVTQGKGVMAFNGKDGNLLWSNDIYTHGGNVSPALYDVNKDGVKDILASGHSCFALNGKDGELLWEYNESSGMHASPLVMVRNSSVEINFVASYGDLDIFSPDGTKLNGVGLTYGMFSSPVPNGQGFVAEGISWGGNDGVLTFTNNTSKWELDSTKGYYSPRMNILSERIVAGKTSASAIAADINNDKSVEFLIPDENGTLIITDPIKEQTDLYKMPSGAEASLFITDFDKDGSYTIFYAGLDGYLRSYEVGKVKKVVWPGFRGPTNDGVFYEK